MFKILEILPVCRVIEYPEYNDTRKQDRQKGKNKLE